MYAIPRKWKKQNLTKTVEKRKKETTVKAFVLEAVFFPSKNSVTMALQERSSYRKATI